MSSPVDVLQSTTGPQVTIQSGPPTAGCVSNVIYIGYGPQSLTLTAMSTPAAVHYLWSTGDTTQSITVNLTGVYSVTAWDASGCASAQTAQSQFSVKVVDVRCGADLKKITICHVPNCDTTLRHTICIAASAVPFHLANHSCDCLGACGTPRLMNLASEENERVSIYPNPSSNTFTLHREETDEPVTLLVRDVTGRIVEFYSDVHADIQFGSMLSEGVYTIEVITASDRGVMKVIKLH